MTTQLRYDDARNDSNLIGFPLTLYYYLYHDLLDPTTFSPVKQEAVALRWGVSTDTVKRTLDILVELEYIERGPAVRPGEMRCYRLVWRRMPDELRDSA